MSGVPDAAFYRERADEYRRLAEQWNADLQAARREIERLQGELDLARSAASVCDDVAAGRMDAEGLDR